MKSMGEMLAADSEARQCEKHGEYTASMLSLAGREIWTDCPVCDKERRKEEEGRGYRERWCLIEAEPLLAGSGSETHGCTSGC